MPYYNYSERVLKIPLLEQKLELEPNLIKNITPKSEQETSLQPPEQNLLSCIGYTPVNLICINASIVLDSFHNGMVKINMNFENTIDLNYNKYDINIFYFNNKSAIYSSFNVILLICCIIVSFIININFGK